MHVYLFVMILSEVYPVGLEKKSKIYSDTCMVHIFAKLEITYMFVFSVKCNEVATIFNVENEAWI